VCVRVRALGPGEDNVPVTCALPPRVALTDAA